MSHLPQESQGRAPGRGRLSGRRILVVGGGQMDIGEADTPIGNGRAIACCARAKAPRSPSPIATAKAPKPPSRCARRPRASRSPPTSRRKRTSSAWCARRSKVLGGIDGIVLNVGIGAGGPWLEGTTAESWNKVFAINLTSHMLTVKAALPRADRRRVASCSSPPSPGSRAGSRLPAYDCVESRAVRLMPSRRVRRRAARRSAPMSSRPA